MKIVCLFMFVFFLLLSAVFFLLLCVLVLVFEVFFMGMGVNSAERVSVL